MSLDSDQIHISSLVVHCMPGLFDQALSQVKSMENVEVHAPNPIGKFVALLETEHERDILSMISRIEEIDGVLNATMVYHEIDYCK